MTPILASQLDAAAWLYSQLTGWQLKDRAIEQLHSAFPGMGIEDCLLKAVAINALYGTQILAIAEVSRDLSHYLQKAGDASSSVKLVEDLASIRARRMHSFASKFCHFFIDASYFPILDAKAVSSVRRHLGDKYSRDASARPYETFFSNFQRLRNESPDIRGASIKAIDIFLWLSCAELEFRRGLKVNNEVAALFKRPYTAKYRESLV